MFDYFRAITVIPLGDYKVRTVISEDPEHNNRVYVFKTDITAISDGIEPEIAKLGDVNGLELREGSVVGINFRNSTKLIPIKEAIEMIILSVLPKEITDQYIKILEESQKSLLSEYSLK